MLSKMKISTLICFVLVATLFVVTSLADEDVSGGILLMFYYNSLLMPISKVFDFKKANTFMSLSKTYIIQQNCTSIEPILFSIRSEYIKQ